MPASAGPTITMIPKVIPLSADAAGRSSRGISRGTIAWRAAMTMVFAAAFTMLRAYSHQTVSELRPRERCQQHGRARA